MDKRLSLGINASIILTLVIFCALLSLPLRLLFNTNYEANNSTENDSQPSLEKVEKRKENVFPLKIKDFRKMKVCPFEYDIWMKSPFVTNYDENCTKKQLIKEEPQLPLKEKEEEKEEEEDEEKPVSLATDQNGSETVSASVTTSMKKEVKGTQKNKSIPVAVHILAMMLVVSVIAALVEVVRIRFARDKDTSTSGGNVNSRRGSIINFMAQKKFMPREMLKSQRSLDLQVMHRSTRLLGKSSRLRRSSFPIQITTKIIESGSGSPVINRFSERPSIDSEDEISRFITTLHHRPHLIRRH